MANNNMITSPGKTRPVNIMEVNIEIPEAMVQQAAMVVGGNNSFAQLLLTGECFRSADLTPLYLTNESQSALRVTALEYIQHPNILN